MKHALWLLVGFALASASAEAAEVRLQLSGSDYDGGPAFDLAFGHTVIGRGVVDTARDAGSGCSFDFDVSDLLLAASPDLRIRFTNDARGGPGEDRNLYIISATVNGTELPIANFLVLAQGEPRLHRLRNGHLELWSGNEVAVLKAPANGWPLGEPALRPGLASLEASPGW